MIINHIYDFIYSHQLFTFTCDCNSYMLTALYVSFFYYITIRFDTSKMFINLTRKCIPNPPYIIASYKR